MWSPKELYLLFSRIRHGNLFYPIFLLPKKAINLERDRNREYIVGADRVATCWESFAKWEFKIPQIFYDNSNILAIEMAKNIIEEQGLN
ncbi:MAG: hypothetical protein H0X50_10710 [Nitrosopumilus sp.]|nr:hypothetical protein [Nitrosopumilus sp.]